MKHFTHYRAAIKGILLIAIVGAIAMPLYNILVIYPTFKQQFVQNVEDAALRVANHLKSYIILETTELSKNTLSTHDLQMLQKAVRDFNLWKLRLFSASGEIVYSTESSEIGEVNQKSYFHGIVAKGETYTSIVSKGYTTADGQKTSLSVAEIYIPIMKGNRFIGAFEIYYDITAKKEGLNEHIQHYSYILLFISLIFIALILSLIKAYNGIITERDKWDVTFDSINHPIAIIGKNHELIRINRAMAKMIQIPKEKAVGLKCYEVVHSIDGPLPQCPHSKLLSQMVSNAEEIIYEKNLGGWFYVSVSPIYDSKGQFLASVHIAYDINERKEMEDALREKTAELEKLNECLELKVKEEMQARLQKEEMLIHQSRLAAMGEMINAIAHQWRQPLNSLALIIQDIRDAFEFGDLDKDYLSQSADKAMKQINFMSKAIDDFKNFFRPDKEKTKFDVKMAVADVLSMLSAQLKANNISYRLTCHVHNKTDEDFTRVIPCDAFMMEGYENEIKHVILNLINNAKDAILQSRERGQKADVQRGWIIFDFEKQGQNVIIRVTDNGGGIKGEIIDRIFDPYFTTKEGCKGTGIGLYMSKMIIEKNMAGKISVRNVDGGAEFKIELSEANPKK